MTNIEWTDKTWNPIVGCSIVSKGTGKVALASESKITEPLRWKKPCWVFVNSMGDLFHESVPDEWIDQVFAVMALCPQHTFQVLTKRPERMKLYFAGRRENFCRASDILHNKINHTEEEYKHELASDWLDIFDTMGKPQPNVWLGVSVEDQDSANERIPLLLETPAAVRFISAEPLLEFVDLTRVDPNAETGSWYEPLRGIMANEYGHFGKTEKIDWVICGGESGPDARPMHPDWARSLRDQCQAADVPFFFTQWGVWEPVSNDDVPDKFGDECKPFRTMCSNGFVGDLSICSGFMHKPHRWPQCFPDGADGEAICTGQIVKRVGKKCSGRLLDGVEHNGVPEIAGVAE